jgi:hypothetical protein
MPQAVGDVSQAVGGVLCPSVNCSWQAEDDKAFLDYLFSQKSSLSTGGFPKHIFQGAVNELKRKGQPRRGAEKTLDLCKTRWKKVCISFIHVLPIF